MEKLDLHTPDLTAENIQKLAELFPSVITEAIDGEGQTIRAIDFDLLRQEVSDHVVEGPQERYRLEWPGKRAALLTANLPISKTLRPMRDESVNFDTTKNLFIEGDNLDALKLLQEAYIGKIKLIYIDPPYNTGNDFVYADDFAEAADTYLAKSRQVDDAGNRLVANTESNGRFHSDWLSMMYPRLKLARHLLSEDGLIFISVDSNEVHNLRKICDELFGATSHKNTIAVRRGIKNVQAQFSDLSSLSQGHEYILVYARNADTRIPKLSLAHGHTKPGKWDTFWRGTDRPTMRYELLGVHPDSGQWRWEESRSLEAVRNYELYLAASVDGLSLDEYYMDHLTATNGKLNFVRKSDQGVVQYYVPPSEGKILSDNWMDITLSGNRTKEFDTEKSTALLQRIVEWVCDREDIVLDFFAGSGTIGHATMVVNALDGGSRRFILVQLDEPIGTSTVVGRSEFQTIAELSRERVRREGRELQEADGPVDVGFRALRIDASTRADVLRRPDELEQEELALVTNSVKTDRSDEDLLFQVLLDWGLDLAAPIATETIEEREIFVVGDGSFIACFAESVTPEVVAAIAERQPLRAVFRDSAFESDADRVNADQVFAERSPSTDIKTI